MAGRWDTDKRANRGFCIPKKAVSMAARRQESPSTELWSAIIRLDWKALDHAGPGCGGWSCYFSRCVWCVKAVQECPAPSSPSTQGSRAVLSAETWRAPPRDDQAAGQGFALHKAASLLTVVICRIYMSLQNQGGDPAAATAAWFAQSRPTISSSACDYWENYNEPAVSAVQ